MPKVHDTSASGPYADLISAQLGLTLPPRTPPDDLLAALGTRRAPAFTIPVVEAVREGASLVFRCTYCRGRKHRHGAHIEPCHPECACPRHGRPYSQLPCWCFLGAGDGHRSAHCRNPASPYKQTGYILREVAR